MKITKERFIVAEISKNWLNAASSDPAILSQMFEAVINRNLERGYRLHSFQLNRVLVSPEYDLLRLNETIIAVFELCCVCDTKGIEECPLHCQ